MPDMLFSAEVPPLPSCWQQHYIYIYKCLIIISYWVGNSTKLFTQLQHDSSFDQMPFLMLRVLWVTIFRFAGLVDSLNHLIHLTLYPLMIRPIQLCVMPTPMLSADLFQLPSSSSHSSESSTYSCLVSLYQLLQDHKNGLCSGLERRKGTSYGVQNYCYTDC